MAAPVAQEVALLRNAPGLPAIYQLLQQREQQLDVITNQVNDLQASVKRIPMQLYNATASADAPLLYPLGVVPGLPPVAAEVPITQRRQVLMDYLGCGMRAYA